MTTASNSKDKEKVIRAFLESLHLIDYPDSHIQREYGYSDFLGNGQRLSADLAAFGNAVPSLRTCNIAVAVEAQPTPDRMERLRSLGAPLLFAFDTHQKVLSRWRVPARGLPEKLESLLDFALDSLPAYFAEHRAQWNPESFRQARTAIFRDTAAQLDFFDAGLLPELEDKLRRKLSTQLQNIAARSRGIVANRVGEAAFDKHFGDYASLLFCLLAARLLSDRGDLDQNIRTTDAATVLQEVKRKYRIGEDSASVLDDVVQNQVWDDLRNGLDLRNLSPETLAYVYENTLVDPDVRRLNGIHTTPPQVADYLLSQLPIGRLPEAERTVFEPFCGNAPLLLAAMRRLRELLPADRTPLQVHSYLVDRLFGIERLPFAREIARYSLILGDYPNDNNWQVLEADAFLDPTFDTFLKQASIVVSNPPHEDFATLERPAGALHNRAAEAMRRVLLTPPRLLGFIMPLSFVDGNSFKGLRRQLVETYPSISVTALPDNVFGNASQQTALIAAHRLDAQTRYVWAEVTKNDYRTNFSVTGKPSVTEEQALLPVDKDAAPILWQRPQGDSVALWKWLGQYSTLDTIAEAHRGLEWKGASSQASSTTNTVSETEREGFASGLHKVESTAESFVTASIKYLDVHPESARGNALNWKWAAPKVLLNAAPMSRSAWRMFGILDTEGLYASQQFIAVWPSAKSTVEYSAQYLSGLLNGPVANLFVHVRCGKRHNNVRAINKIPIPPYNKGQVQEIAEAVDAYVDLRWQFLDTPTPWTGNLAERARRALIKIDAAVLNAYALPSDLENLLLRHFDGIERRHLPITFTGYDADEWASVKAELEDEREERRIADAFSALLTKSNLYGLSADEQQEYDRLDDARTERRDHQRELIASGK